MTNVERSLEAAGTAPIEAVAPRLDALERRVMAACRGERPTDGAVIVPLRSRRMSRRYIVGAAAACLIAFVVLGAGWFGRDADSLVVAAAEDVELVLPDGSVVAASAGVELRPGTKIDVEGSLVVSGITYGPGSYEVTDRGVIAADDAGVVDSTTTTSTTPTTATTPAVTTTVAADRSPPPTVRPATGTAGRPPTTLRRDDAAPSTRPPRDRDIPASTTATTLRPPSTRPATTVPGPADRPTTTVRPPELDRTSTTVPPATTDHPPTTVRPPTTEHPSTTTSTTTVLRDERRGTTEPTRRRDVDDARRGP